MLSFLTSSFFGLKTYPLWCYSMVIFYLYTLVAYARNITYLRYLFRLLIVIAINLHCHLNLALISFLIRWVKVECFIKKYRAIIC